MNTVATAEHLRHALALKPEEEVLLKEIGSWLPDEIVDCHAHCNLDTHVKSVNDRAFGHMLSTFTYFSIEDSQRVQALLHPKQKIRTLRFAKTFRGIDHRTANAYLLEQNPSENRIAVFGLPEDFDYTTGVMRHPRASALKMYWSYVDPPAEKIYDFFTPEILEVAQELDLPIILHLPKTIARTCDDLMQMLSDFPRLRVVLAHLGLSKMVIPGLEDAFVRAATSPNVWLDTALNPSEEVMMLAAKHFGWDRIMFGSDEPLNLIRSAAYTHPEKGERIVTDYPYHWVDQAERNEYGHLARNAVHAHWRCITAIKCAIQRLPVAEQEKTKLLIFHDTAKDFFKF